MFLHRGELNRLSPTTPGDLEFSTLHDESFQHADRFGPISCPACADRPMKKVEFNIHSGIVLDFCADCGGFWLDGHELERIGEEVRQLEQTDDSGPGHRMQWFAQFLWSLPR
jgi:Zn-finger nucleic acid-binding protein